MPAGGTGRVIRALDPNAQSRPPAERVQQRSRFHVGEYELQVCVDVTDRESESNERNNCERIKKSFSRFYSAYYNLAG